MFKNVVEFFCYENDEPLEVQLEPEAIVFIVKKGKHFKFVGTSDIDDFHWAIRINHKEKGIQLFPESLGNYSIEIFGNNILVEDWCVIGHFKRRQQTNDRTKYYQHSS